MKHVRTWFPAPLLSLALLVIWLLLSQTLAAGQVLLGIAIGLVVPALTASLRPQRPRLHRPWLAVPMFSYFIYDMLRSNLQAARVILGAPAAVESGFVTIRLELTDPHALLLLAVFVNASPGTTWARYSAEHREVTLHVLDMRSCDEVVDAVRRRYEVPLLGIFE